MLRNVVLLASGLLLLTLPVACKRQEGVQNSPQNSAATKSPQAMQTPLPLKPGPITYLALGDSTGAGVGAQHGGYVARLSKRIAQVRPGSKLVNVCFSGATTDDVLRDQLNNVERADPQLITLGIGINDIGHGQTLEQFSKNYEAILTRLEKQSGARIVVSNIPDISASPRIPPALRGPSRDIIRQFNQKLEEVASNHRVTVFDIYSITHEQLPLHPEYFSVDKFHPSDEGYELWAETMWPTVARAVALEISE